MPAGSRYLEEVEAVNLMRALQEVRSSVRYWLRASELEIDEAVCDVLYTAFERPEYLKDLFEDPKGVVTKDQTNYAWSALYRKGLNGKRAKESLREDRLNGTPVVCKKEFGKALECGEVFERLLGLLKMTSAKAHSIFELILQSKEVTRAQSARLRRCLRRLVETRGEFRTLAYFLREVS